MNDQERDKVTERWLDSALDRYSDAEPRPGYETRLLASIAAQRAERPLWRAMWMWAVTAATAAIIITVISLSVGHKRQTPTVANALSAVPSQTATIPTAPAATGRQSNLGAPLFPAVGKGGNEHQVQTARAQRPTVQHQTPRLLAATTQPTTSAPKQPQFPTPAPLNDQERMLLTYVHNTSQQEMETVIAQKQAFQKHVESLGVPKEQEKDDR